MAWVPHWFIQFCIDEPIWPVCAVMDAFNNTFAIRFAEAPSRLVYAWFIIFRILFLLALSYFGHSYIR